MSVACLLSTHYSSVFQVDPATAIESQELEDPIVMVVAELEDPIVMVVAELEDPIVMVVAAAIASACVADCLADSELVQTDSEIH